MLKPENLIKTKTEANSQSLRWREIVRRDDLVTEFAWDGHRALIRQRNIPQATLAAFDHNEQLRNHVDPMKGPDRTWRHEAHLTPAAIMWLREHKGIDVFNPDHMDGLKRVLNDPEFRKLRTSTGGF